MSHQGARQQCPLRNTDFLTYQSNTHSSTRSALHLLLNYQWPGIITMDLNASHNFQRERKASSCARYIFHKFNEKRQTGRNVLQSSLTRQRIENEARENTKLWDQNDGTSAVPSKSWEEAVTWEEDSTYHPFKTGKANYSAFQVSNVPPFTCTLFQDPRI